MSDFFGRNPTDIIINERELPSKTKEAALRKEFYGQFWLSAKGTENENMVMKWIFV